MNLNNFIQESHDRVNHALAQWLPSFEEGFANLPSAMKYAVLNGGKRLRPLLIYATGAALSVPAPHLDAAACAVELTHAYSLVHDDLPAMDNDDLRRGQPTCHKAFNEATAILAGDALQTLAFQILASDQHSHLSDKIRLEMIKTLAHASGCLGMAGGQALDLDATGKPLTLTALEKIHRYKTGALIKASVRMGALASPTVTDTQLEQLDKYATHLGFAFQIQDDILDVEGNTELLGKQIGMDVALGKSTYPALLGIEKAKQMVIDLHEQAISAIQRFDESANHLRDLARFLSQRIH
jgi:geranylgeranyl diphosphate synthase, type II